MRPRPCALRLIVVATIFGLIVTAPLLVLVTGGTFGQRCARAFPLDNLAQERCVFDLSSGRNPWGTR